METTLQDGMDVLWPYIFQLGLDYLDSSKPKSELQLTSFLGQTYKVE